MTGAPRRNTRRRTGTLLCTLALALLTGVGVLAYFTSSGSGTAGAAVGTLAEPTVTATSPSPGVADVAWSAVPAPTGAADDAEIEFTVERKPSPGSSWVLVCGTDTAPKAHDELSCSDGPPGDEEYDYRVTASFRTWTSSGEDSVYVAGGSVPSVTSITRADPSPTNTASVRWDVTFSKDVTGVDETDFALMGAGAVGASIADVSGSGALYVVEADTGAEGSLGLNLEDDDSIEDLGGAPLGGQGAGNGDFTGDAYVVDTTLPAVTSIDRSGVSPTSTGPLTWTVTFSEPVSGVVPVDFGLITSGITGTPTISAATPSGSAPTATWTVTASAAGVTGTNSGSIRLDLTSVGVITDTAANPLAGTFTGQAYTFDTTAPSIVSLEMLDVDEDGRVDRVEATFDEALAADGVGTSPWTLASVPSGGALADVSVSGTVATLSIAEGTGPPNTVVGSFTVALAAAADGIRDDAGNDASFAATAPSDGAAPVAVDVQAVDGPGTAGRIDSGDVVTYTFSEPMSPGSILSGWSGASTAVAVELGNDGSNDTVEVITTGVSLGLIETGGNYVRNTRTVNATMALSGTTVTLTLTSTAPPGQLLTVASSTMTWTPSSAAADPAGNAMVATPRTQMDAPKQNF